MNEDYVYGLIFFYLCFLESYLKMVMTYLKNEFDVLEFSNNWVLIIWLST